VRNATLRLYASVAAVVAGPLLLAALGVTHPQDLTEETASWWHELHTILVVVFPLLGLNLWWLLRGLEGVTAWLSRVAGFLYIVFYGALDVLAGVGTGATVEAARREGRETLDDGNPLLFDEGNAFADVGVWALLIGWAIAVILIVRRVGRSALPGALLLVLGCVLFLDSHIYWPEGVLAVLVLGAGFGLLEWARVRDAPLADRAGSQAGEERVDPQRGTAPLHG